MSIQKKKYFSKKQNKEVIKYFAVVYDKEAQKSIWSDGFAKESDAKIYEGQILQSLKKGKHIGNNGNIYFETVKGLWLEEAKKEYANSTYQTYLWYTEKYLCPVFSRKILKKLTPAVIQKFVDGFTLKYSAETANKCLNILSDIFKYALSKEMVYSNPVLEVKRKKVKLKDIHTWRESNIRQFLADEKVQTSRYYEMLLLSFSTGLRPSEICGLSEEMLKGNILYIERGYDQYNAVTNLKNQRSHRRLALPDELVQILRKRIERQKIESRREGYQQNDFLFKQANGAPINPHNYSKRFKSLLRQYNNKHAKQLPDVTLYEATRHSFGTNMTVYHKQPASIVSSLMGNSERVLQSRYVHPDDDIKAVTLLEYGQKILLSKKTLNKT